MDSQTIEVKFYFKFLPEAEVAHDEDNNPVEVYAYLSLEVLEPLDEGKYKEAQELFKQALATQVDTDVNYILPISEEEYLNNAYEEDGESLKGNVLIGTAIPEDEGAIGEFNSIAHLLPEDVRDDVIKRINDWLETGGTADDKYIINQVEYAKRVLKAMGGEENEPIPEESSSESTKVCEGTDSCNICKTKEEE